jgi:hypothetical protein
VSDGTRYADTAFQKLLQSVPETRHIEGQGASASRWLERSLLDAQGIANLQRGNYFKDHVGSTPVENIGEFSFGCVSSLNSDWRNA